MRGAGCISPPHCGDIVPRTNDKIDQPGQLLINELLFSMIFVPVVDSSHTTDDMAEAAFGMIARHASATLETPGGSPQVVQRLYGDAACIVALGLAVTADGGDAVVREHI